MEKRTATVVKHTGSHYLLSVLPEWAPFPAVIRGKLRLAGSKATNPIAVGDRVEFEGETITKILPRKNYVIRRSTNLSRESHIIAANLDRVFLIVTIILPETKLAFVDRFLVTCEAYGIRPVILINKVDLYTEPELQEQLADFKALYRGAGYEVLEISARKGTGISQVRALCREGLTLFSGASGVGKSSLLKALDPTLDPKIGEISLSHLQGKHTTTFYEMPAQDRRHRYGRPDDRACSAEGARRAREPGEQPGCADEQQVRWLCGARRQQDVSQCRCVA